MRLWEFLTKNRFVKKKIGICNKVDSKANEIVLKNF